MDPAVMLQASEKLTATWTKIGDVPQAVDMTTQKGMMGFNQRAVLNDESCSGV